MDGLFQLMHSDQSHSQSHTHSGEMRQTRGSATEGAVSKAQKTQQRQRGLDGSGTAYSD